MTKQILTVCLACLEALIFTAQLTTLASTYWTSWNLRINWTQTLNGEINNRPPSDGQLVSEGHAGLWSRCVKVQGSGKDFNDSRLNADKCLSNFNDLDQWESFNYGKTCKMATAGLCVVELVVTFFLLVIILTAVFCRRTPRFLCALRLPLVTIQGVTAVLTPVLYISGNMAELVDQLTSTYGLLLVVYMEAWYVHDWAYWLQVSLSMLWASTAVIFGMVKFNTNGEVSKRSSANSKNNGRKIGDPSDAPELESLSPSK